ncbi:PREDICTED: uncharacterized protein LOC104785411 [Camelina sativa]|uniref:Uncharacterized protein LOC104785411 n=1 Tax=Camelina sativa TaxID=90675 RepID=A0ABM0Z108_CAMSA|nr:PREDICTED: uncharacterized protein LOC104785411 [Camelina sativa]
MDSIGAFHEVEKDGKLVLVYHHPKYSPIPQTLTVTSSADPSLQPLFLCPHIRLRKHAPSTIYSTFHLPNASPEYTRDSGDHHVMPLFWCNNKTFESSGGCFVCDNSNFGTDYYFCEHCNQTFHKECVQSPLQIKHPYHPKHPLQLSHYRSQLRDNECSYCRRSACYLLYHCTICQVFMHPTCAMKPIPFVIDPPKKHAHPLTFFPRQTSLNCNVCGLLRKIYPTYVCFRCNFVAHNDCMNFPHVIKISRHQHRISFTFSLPSRERVCGVCRQSANGDYGAYTCDKCSDYVVHPICAIEKNVWDGKELQGVPEEDDITQDDGPFEVISEGKILHFLHKRYLQLEVSKVYDENMLCQACSLPIYEGNFYVSMAREYILHETCAKAPRRIQHPLHPHPLHLEVDERSLNERYTYSCIACGCLSLGFAYVCKYELGMWSSFKLDVRCALISEPYKYEGHEHPLFLALDPEIKPMCHVCITECLKPLNCIKCNFILCFKCATLPYKARYKHDPHFLTISCGEEVRAKEWCEICELNLKDTYSEVFYWCNECFTTCHIECLLGGNPNMKPGQYFYMKGAWIQILPKCNTSRPLCHSCKNRCLGRIYALDSRRIACSYYCMENLFENLYKFRF